jgi:acetyltransferase-like isoleucine patch superfamily enzyme
LFIKGLIAFLPSSIKCFLYRHVYGYNIGSGVRIGLSIIDAAGCQIGDNVTIGHLNLVIQTNRFEAGEHTRIGHLNIFRGGDEIRLGRYSEVVRFNEINSILEPDVVNPVDPRFSLGDGSVITTQHKIDFTDRVQIGKRVILGGRNSSLWTHNRQMTKPIIIGDNCYLGSEIRIAPGGAIPADCIVGIGSVVTKALEESGTLIAGVPARAGRALDETGRFLTENKTRPDLPDDI